VDSTANIGVEGLMTAQIADVILREGGPSRATEKDGEATRYHLTRSRPNYSAIKGGKIRPNPLALILKAEKMASMSAILSPAQTADKPKLLDQVRDVIRRKHFSIRTEQTYVDWIKRYIFFHGKRSPNEMAEAEITAFLTHLARAGKVAASTQNQHVKASLTCRERLQEQQHVLRLHTSLGSRLGFLHRLHE